MNVIFLDIDGVLNTHAFRLTSPPAAFIDERHMVNLQKLCITQNAVVVLTSTWRKYWDINPIYRTVDGSYLHTLFQKYNIPLIDKTPYFSYRYRADEIQYWLSKNPSVTNYIIIDNDNELDWGSLREHVIYTSDNTGLDLSATNKAIMLLQCEQSSILL